jgi:NAD(P)H-hydrate epimerase
MCGRAVLLAGSRGTLGAAHLCTAGAVRGGAGLVSLGALPDVYDLLAVTMIPEVMVRPLTKLTDIFNFPVDAIGIGPGLGSGQEARTLRVVREAPCPAVVDADALTVIAHAGLQHVDQAKGPRLLTPHPGEMQRLLAGRKISNRGQVARDFTDKHSVTLLLKGARTVIAQRGLPLRFNTTGHPGMATGGMGDVLTGLCTALLAQGADTYQAASIGAWVCGRAAEIAVVQGASTESLTPSDVLEKLGSAFRSLRAGIGIRYHRLAVPGNDAPVEIRLVVLFLLDDFVSPFGGRMASFARGHRKIHSDMAIDEKEPALFPRGNLDRGVLSGRLGKQLGVPVGQLGPIFLRAEVIMLSAVLRHQPGPGILEGCAGGQAEHCSPQQSMMQRSPHRLGKPETVVRMPVIIE